MLRTLTSLALIAAVWFAVISALAFWHRQTAAGGIEQAQFQFSENASSLPDDVRWQEVRLPHVWMAPAEYGWYRLHFAAQDSAQALMLNQVSMHAAVWLNGRRLGDSGGMDDPVSQHWFQPLFFPLPAQALRAGENEISILVRASPPGSGFLGRIQIGDDRVVRRHYQQRAFLKSGALQLIALLLVALSLPAALLGYWRRTDNVYVWYTVSGLVFALHIVLLSVPQLPLPTAARDWLFFASLSGFTSALTVFIHRFLELPRPRVEFWLWLVFIAGNVVMAGLAAYDLSAMHRFADWLWAPASCALGLYPSVLLVQRFGKRPDTGGFWLLTSGALIVATSARDMLVLNHLIAPFDGFFSQYVAVFGFITFACILMRNFYVAASEAETLNRELESRVREREHALEQSYQALQRADEQRTLISERERILRDMHDGLGGTLISALARLRNEGAGDSATGRALRNALDDLRLILHSLEPAAKPLRVALSLLRERLAERAADAGLALDWDVSQLPEDFELGRRDTLQVLRIVQEAFTNCVQHARARRFALSLKLDAAHLQLHISDDGIGFDTTRTVTPGGGYGMRNLHQRAASLGAQIRFESAVPGTRLILELPVKPP